MANFLTVEDSLQLAAGIFKRFLFIKLWRSGRTAMPTA
jgi:hypothetical protein